MSEKFRKLPRLEGKILKDFKDIGSAEDFFNIGGYSEERIDRSIDKLVRKGMLNELDGGRSPEYKTNNRGMQYLTELRKHTPKPTEAGVMKLIKSKGGQYVDRDKNKWLTVNNKRYDIDEVRTVLKRMINKGKVKIVKKPGEYPHIKRYVPIKHRKKQ